MTDQPKPDRHDLWQRYFTLTANIESKECFDAIEAYVKHLEAELHQTHCELARHQITHWPRIRDLPEAERVPFRKWLTGQTVPMIDGLPYEEQDGYYRWDYERWRAQNARKAGKAVVD